MAGKPGLMERLSSRATEWTGTSWAFVVAFASVAIWAAFGPFVDPPFLNTTYQLVINTGTTIITFLMVFLIQRSQNKDSKAIQLKLNELVAAVKGASNRLINVEDLTESEVAMLHRHYVRLAELSKKDKDLTRSHSVEEAEDRHRSKRAAGGQACGTGDV